MKKQMAIAGAVAVLGLAACAPMGPGPGSGGGPMMGGGYGYHMGPGYGMGMGMGGNGPGMMMGGYGPGMMMGDGPGMMMPGFGALPSSLDTGQRAKVAEIQRDLRSKQWPLMQQMHAAMWNEGAASPSAAPVDEQAARKQYEAVAGLHKQMFDNMLEARKRLDAVLTPQQREEWRRSRAPG